MEREPRKLALREDVLKGSTSMSRLGASASGARADSGLAMRETEFSFVADAADEYRLAMQIHLACTQREPRERPSARQLSSWIATADNDTAQPMMSDCAGHQ